MTAPDAGDLLTALGLAVLALTAVFFALRPELWHRLWASRIDARPVALMRIAFGLIVLWTFASLAPHLRIFLSDEGMWLPEMARAYFGGPLRHLWDAEHGFEHWWSPLLLPYGRLTILHYWNPPWLVLALYALLLVSASLMVLGAWTRWTTLATWALALQLYRFQPMYLSGGDAVIQNFLFLGVFTPWGEAYSVDRWRARRASPARPLIPAWPVRLMMLQVAVIYSATGLLKRGGEWASGEALYYALNLDHFYRVPAQAFIAQLHHAGVLPLLNHAVRWWEMLFPVVLLCTALAGWEAERAPAVSGWRRRFSWSVATLAWLALAAGAGALAGVAGRPAWIVAAVMSAAPIVAILAYRGLRAWSPAWHRRLVSGLPAAWLLFGVLLHLGIDLGINVGTFANVMVSAYLVWLGSARLDWLERRVKRPIRLTARLESR